MRVRAFTIDGIPFRPLLEQVFSRLLLGSEAVGVRTLGQILLLLSTLEIVSLAVADLIE